MTPTGWQVTIAFPYRLPVLPNLRSARFVRARVVKQIRQDTGLMLQAQAREFRRGWDVMKSNPRLRLQVLQVRHGPVKLDDDNCTGSFKPVRDAIATFFGIDDGSDRWVWLPCAQQLDFYQVRIFIRVVVAPSDFVEKQKRLKLPKKFKPTPNVRKPR